MTKYENYVVITSPDGKKRAFYNFHELIKYLDSFKMSFLPDGYSYSIHEEWFISWAGVDIPAQNNIKQNLSNPN